MNYTLAVPVGCTEKFRKRLYENRARVGDLADIPIHEDPNLPTIDGITWLLERWSEPTGGVRYVWR